MSYVDLNAMMPVRTRATLRLRPGDHVLCPRCRRVMLKCKKRPVSGDSEWHKWFDQVEFKNNRPGAMPWCPYDGNLFYDPMQGVFTLEHGWTF